MTRGLSAAKRRSQTIPRWSTPQWISLPESGARRLLQRRESLCYLKALGADGSKHSAFLLSAHLNSFFSKVILEGPSPPATPTSLLEPAVPSEAQEKKRKGKRRGKKSSRPRGGKELKAAGGDAYQADTRRLQKKFVSGGDLYQTNTYSIEKNGSKVSTGWQGRNPPPRARAEIRRLYRRKEMQGIIEGFFPVYANW